MPGKIRADDRKFRELIIFFAEKSEGDRTFGATKLNKLLFFSDFVAYLKYGKPITGHTYQKLDNGPAPRALLPIVRKMEEDGDVTQATHDYFGKVQKRLVARRAAKLDDFSGPEVDLMHEAIDEFWGKNATEMSDMSHDFIGWQLADTGEDIPYEAALVGFQPPSKGVVSEGLKLAKLAETCLAEHEKTQDHPERKLHQRAR